MVGVWTPNKGSGGGDTRNRLAPTPEHEEHLEPKLGWGCPSIPGTSTMTHSQHGDQPHRVISWCILLGEGYVGTLERPWDRMGVANGKKKKKEES